MLAAESAWRVLRAEHARMRASLRTIERQLAQGGWRAGGTALAQLQQRTAALREFEAATHRPKGELLLATLRRRSPEVAALLEELEGEQCQCEALLDRALERLAAAARGEPGAADDGAAALRRHRELMLPHLDKEDTALHSRSAQLLTAEEWSLIVSSISSVVHPASRLPEGGDEGL